MSEFKDKFDGWLDDAWKVDTFIDEYNYEVKRRQKKPLCKECKRPKQDVRNKFVYKHTALAIIILVGLGILSWFIPWFWIAFFIYLFKAL